MGQAIFADAPPGLLEMRDAAQTFLNALGDAALEHDAGGLRVSTIARMEWAVERMGTLVGEFRTESVGACVATMRIADQSVAS